MHHAAAEDLQPVVALAEPHLAARAAALDVDLAEGSVNGKKLRAEAHLHVVGTSKNALQNASSVHFRWPMCDAPVDDQAFQLVEHRRVGLVGVAAIGAARAR